jgi:hypothetical protein
VSLDGIARNVTACGDDAATLADELARQLDRSDLRLAIVFADWRIDPVVLSRTLRRALPGAPTVGCTTLGVLAIGQPRPTAAAIGLYGDWLDVGIGVATELSKAPLGRSRDAVVQAARALDLDPETLDPQRHVAITLVDGTCGHEESFCIGTAATAAQIRFVGGGASAEVGVPGRTFVWANGEAWLDAGVVVLFDSQRRHDVVASTHLVTTDLRTVVTAGSGRVVDQLDGKPAAVRLGQLISKLGRRVDLGRPTGCAFARIVDGIPSVRSMTRIDGDRIYFPSGVEVGHILHVMRPGNLIEVTRRDLAFAAERLGGEIQALIAFSCVGRHWEAAAHGLEDVLADAYAEYPTTGCQSFAEQTGILLVNHTLTALAIGASR